MKKLLNLTMVIVSLTAMITATIAGGQKDAWITGSITADAIDNEFNLRITTNPNADWYVIGDMVEHNTIDITNGGVTHTYYLMHEPLSQTGNLPSPDIVYELEAITENPNDNNENINSIKVDINWDGNDIYDGLLNQLTESNSGNISVPADGEDMDGNLNKETVEITYYRDEVNEDKTIQLDYFEIQFIPENS